jgi:hypothetical protein
MGVFNVLFDGMAFQARRPGQWLVLDARKLYEPASSLTRRQFQCSRHQAHGVPAFVGHEVMPQALLSVKRDVEIAGVSPKGAPATMPQLFATARPPNLGDAKPFDGFL